MRKITEETDIFFPNSNFQNISFCINCPTLKEEEKKFLSENIIKFKGVRKNFYN